MTRYFTAFLLILMIGGRASAEATVTQPSTRPATPYKVEAIIRTAPDIRAYVVRIDLTDPNVQFAIGAGGPDPDGDGPWETILQPTSAIARANQFDIAINTVFFMNKGGDPNAKVHVYRPGEWAMSVAMLMSEGKLITGRRGGASVIFDRQNRAYIGKVNEIPLEAYTIVTGDQQLVFRGRNTAPADKTLGPRSALGLADQGKTLVMLVVDGRRPGWSVGMSLAQLADELIALGCDNAINLDGGGSATLVRREDDKYKVVNTPSDGSTLPIGLSIERSIPYALGVRFKAANTK